MTILYDYKDSLYINMTNKCPCACVFCIRDETDHVGNSDSLWLDHEPTVEEVKNEFEKFDLDKKIKFVFLHNIVDSKEIENKLVPVINELKNE